MSHWLLLLAEECLMGDRAIGSFNLCLESVVVLVIHLPQRGSSAIASLSCLSVCLLQWLSLCYLLDHQSLQQRQVMHLMHLRQHSHRQLALRELITVSWIWLPLFNHGIHCDLFYILSLSSSSLCLLFLMLCCVVASNNKTKTKTKTKTETETKRERARRGRRGRRRRRGTRRRREREKKTRWGGKVKVTRNTWRETKVTWQLASLPSPDVRLVPAGKCTHKRSNFVTNNLPASPLLAALRKLKSHLNFTRAKFSLLPFFCTFVVYENMWSVFFASIRSALHLPFSLSHTLFLSLSFCLSPFHFTPWRLLHLTPFETRGSIF